MVTIKQTLSCYFRKPSMVVLFFLSLSFQLIYACYADASQLINHSQQKNYLAPHARPSSVEVAIKLIGEKVYQAVLRADTNDFQRKTWLKWLEEDQPFILNEPLIYPNMRSLLRLDDHFILEITVGGQSKIYQFFIDPDKVTNIQEISPSTIDFNLFLKITLIGNR